MANLSLLDRAAEVRERGKLARAAVERLRHAGDREQWPAIYGAVEDAENDAALALQSAWRALDHLNRIADNAADALRESAAQPGGDQE